MARNHEGTTFRDCLEYAAFRLFVFTFAVLPLSLSVIYGRALSKLWCWVDKRHRIRARDQMHEALGISLEEADKHAREMYTHFGTCIAEIVRIPVLTKENVGEYIDWNGNEETLDNLMAEGNGLIFATGHIGNWEVCGCSFHLKGWSTGAVARPLDNPLIDGYVKGIREACGQEIWDKFGVIRKIVKVLRDKKSFGILIDQDAGKQGIFVPFFRKECSTIPTVADLAYRTGAPIIFAAFHRDTKPMRFKLKVGRIHRADQSADKDAERMRLLTALNEDIEKVISEEPSQWLWLHRRWKTKKPE